MTEIVRDRDELLLNAIATGDATDIDPRDREEKFLKAIADKIGSGTGSQRYLHKLSTSAVVDGLTYTVYVDIINESSDYITTTPLVIANINNVISISGDAAGVGYVGWPYMISVSASRLRISVCVITQDADTKTITGATHTSNFTNLNFNDSVHLI